MKGGDIDNREAPGVWIVWEGVVATPLSSSVRSDPPQALVLPDRQTKYKTMARHRNSFSANGLALKRIEDMAFRRDFRCRVVSFLYNDNAEWQALLQQWLDDLDVPAVARAFDIDAFISNVLPSPGCARVYAPASLSARFGGKGVYVEPDIDFDRFA